MYRKFCNLSIIEREGNIEKETGREKRQTEKGKKKTEKTSDQLEPVNSFGFLLSWSAQTNEVGGTAIGAHWA